MQDFVAIDFETANEQNTSVCSVGVVVVREGVQVESYYSLIHPEPNHYKWYCQKVHGISERDTADARIFPEVWAEIQGLIGELPLVAHNAPFDQGCLKAVFKTYQMDYPDYTFYDTLRASRKKFGKKLPNHQLQTSAKACGYDLLKHHNALADAEACAAIALKLL